MTSNSNLLWLIKKKAVTNSIQTKKPHGKLYVSKNRKRESTRKPIYTAKHTRLTCTSDCIVWLPYAHFGALEPFDSLSFLINFYF